jgi:hypothetical protein
MYLSACQALAPDTQLLIASDLGGSEESIHCATVAQWRMSPIELPKLPTVFGILAFQRDRVQGQRSSQRRKLKHP